MRLSAKIRGLQRRRLVLEGLHAHVETLGRDGPAHTRSCVRHSLHCARRQSQRWSVTSSSLCRPARGRARQSAFVSLPPQPWTPPAPILAPATCLRPSAGSCRTRASSCGAPWVAWLSSCRGTPRCSPAVLPLQQRRGHRRTAARSDATGQRRHPAALQHTAGAPLLAPAAAATGTAAALATAAAQPAAVPSFPHTGQPPKRQLAW